MKGPSLSQVCETLDPSVVRFSVRGNRDYSHGDPSKTGIIREEERVVPSI